MKYSICILMFLAVMTDSYAGIQLKVESSPSKTIDLKSNQNEIVINGLYSSQVKTVFGQVVEKPSVVKTILKIKETIDGKDVQTSINLLSADEASLLKKEDSDFFHNLIQSENLTLVLNFKSSKDVINGVASNITLFDKEMETSYPLATFVKVVHQAEITKRRLNENLKSENNRIDIYQNSIAGVVKVMEKLEKEINSLTGIWTDQKEELRGSSVALGKSKSDISKMLSESITKREEIEANIVRLDSTLEVKRSVSVD